MMPFGIFNRFPRRQNEEMPEMDLQAIFGGADEPESYELPENEALKAYGEHAMNVPQRGDFKNSFLEKLAAGLVGASEGLNRGAGAGMRAGREILDRNYLNAMRDYASQSQALKTQADIEQEGIGQRGRVMEMQERGRERRADRGARMYDYTSRERDRADQAANRAADNARADKEFAERQRSARAQEALEGRRIETYGGMGRRGSKIGPQSRVPVDQYDKARQLAIEKVLVEDPTAQKYFSSSVDNRGNPTGYMMMRPDIEEKGWFRNSQRELTPEEMSHRDQIFSRIEEEQRRILDTMVDPYDREQSPTPQRREPPPFKGEWRGILSR